MNCNLIKPKYDLNKNIKTYPKNAKIIPIKLKRSNIYSAFKPISDANHNNVGLAQNLSNIFGFSFINTFFVGNIPFSPNKPGIIVLY